MEKAAIFHDSQGAMSFETGINEITLRFRSKHGDVTRAELLYSDLYATTNSSEGWHPEIAKMKIILKSKETDYWGVTVALPKTRRLKYAFHLIASSGEEYLYDSHKIESFTADSLTHSAPFLVPYSYPNETFKQQPAWAQNTLWYHILIDRFANGDPQSDPSDVVEWSSEAPSQTNFFGGDLQGIKDHLDHLTDIGVNGLILSPIFAAFSNHKYDAIDPYTIDPYFGNKADFKNLVEESHQHGMHVVLEIVLDHLMSFSMQWQDVKQKGKTSKFFDWFMIDSATLDYKATDDPNFSADISYRVNQNDPHQPKLNLRNSEVKQYLFDLVKYWIVNFDIDGFKVLNPQEMVQQFLAELMQLVHGLKANFCLMSETNSLTPALINNSALDTAIDDDLVEIMLNYFIAKKTNVSEMITALNDDLMKYPTTQQKSMMIQFDGPNDPRLLSLCDDDEQLSRLLLAFTYLLPLSPSLYYGTEYGLKGGQVPANRECMPWKASEQDQTMYRFIKLLGEFRNKYSLVLNDGSLDWGQTSNKNDYLSFTRSSNGKRIFALFNVGYGSIKFIFPPKAKLILSQNLVKDQNRIGHNGFVIVEA